jgi:4-alpha-glucanotransferase
LKIDLNHKLAGILVPTFALRREDDLGVGDTQGMRDAINFCSRNHIGVLQILPINETGGDNSPYNALSSIALDPELLSVTPSTVPYLDREYFEKTLQLFEIERLRTGPVKHVKVKELKLTLLRSSFETFSSKATREEQEHFERFEKENAQWLDNYVLFRTLVAQHGGDARWPIWQPEYATPSEARASMLKAKGATSLEKELRFWAFVQWLADAQWRSVREYADDKAVLLMGDIPYGVSRYSADVWAEREIFDLDWSGGAPPEKFFASDEFTRKWGQNWGMPLYRWTACEDRVFSWWRERIKHATTIFHYFRIDHVLGFFRVYAFPWIPERNAEFLPLTEEEAKKKTGGRLPHFIPHDDETAKNRDLNRDEGRRFLQMTMAAAGDAGIVAEDLGIVPPYCRPLLDELGIPGFYIPFFTRSERDRSYQPKKDIPALTLITYGTHDHEPLVSIYENLVAWWHGADGDRGWQEIQQLMHFLGIETQEPPTEFNASLAEAFFYTLLDSPPWLAVLTITDLLGLKLRFNEPGPVSDENWSQRLSHSLSFYEVEEPFATYIRIFKEAIIRSGRMPMKLAASSLKNAELKQSNF